MITNGKKSGIKQIPSDSTYSKFLVTI